MENVPKRKKEVPKPALKHQNKEASWEINSGQSKKLVSVFSNESVIRIRWPKFWSFSFRNSFSKEYSRLISLRIDWFDLAVHVILKSLLQHHILKTSVLQHSAFFMVQLSHPYMTTGKTTVLTLWTFSVKWCLCFLIQNEAHMKQN